jgi:hypothetical protein
MSAVAARSVTPRFTWRAAQILALSTLCVAQLVESIDVTVDAKRTWSEKLAIWSAISDRTSPRKK